MTEPEEEEDESNGANRGPGLRRFLEDLGEEAQEFARRRPLEGLLLAFLAGVLVSDLLRRAR